MLPVGVELGCFTMLTVAVAAAVVEVAHML